MNRCIRRSLVTAYTVLAGCAALRPAPEEPAVLAFNSPQNRQELSHVVGQALHQPAVMLADEAFLHDDIVIVERRRRRDENGLPLNGREAARPERLRLVKLGSHCYVTREGAARRWRLTQACIALASHP